MQLSVEHGQDYAKIKKKIKLNHFYALVDAGCNLNEINDFWDSNLISFDEECPLVTENTMHSILMS